MPYPPAPWRLKGEGVLQLQTLPIDRVQAWLPAALKVVPVLPGKTLGGVFFGRYGVGSTLQYHELIVIAALARHRGRLGGWISHIYVDDERSLAGGREIWALPKQLARFEDHGGGLRVSTASGTGLIFLRPEPPKQTWRLPLLAPAFGQREDTPLWFRGSGWARVGPSAAHIEIAPDSPFAALELGHGRSFALQALDVAVQPP
jgi:acetoacetate decarboxylase